MSLDERPEVPDATSCCSTSAALRPRDTASRNAPAPTIPPPTTRTSKRSFPSASRALRRTAFAGVSPCPGSLATPSTLSASSAPSPTYLLRPSGVRRTAHGDPPQHHGGPDDEHQDQERGMEDDPLEVDGQEARRHRGAEHDDDRDHRDDRHVAGPDGAVVSHGSRQPRSALATVGFWRNPDRRDEDLAGEGGA